MAIFHFSIEVLKRSEGKSAVVAAAWRSNQVLYDERRGRTVRLPKGKAVLSSEILLPANVPPRFYNRATLWNAVEAAEVRKDSQLARIINVALPTELPEVAARELPAIFAREQLVPLGLPVDLTVSARPRAGDELALLHAYLMFPTRRFGPEGPTAKQRPPNFRAELIAWRQAWAGIVNASLAQVGRSERVDHRSNVARGIAAAPAEHVGLAATNMARRGLKPDRAPTPD